MRRLAITLRFSPNGGQKNVLRIIRTAAICLKDASRHWLDIKSTSAAIRTSNNTSCWPLKQLKPILPAKKQATQSQKRLPTVNVVASGSHAHREEPHALLYELRHPSVGSQKCAFLPRYVAPFGNARSTRCLLAASGPIARSIINDLAVLAPNINKRLGEE